MAHEQLLRLFLAIDLPDAVKSTLSKLQTRLKPIYNAGQYGEPENFHITLHFLGDTAVSRLPLLIDALNDVEMPYLDLRPEALVHFPTPQKARVAAVAMGGDSVMLADLYARLTPIVKDLEFRLDHRPFRPHVTVVQFKFPPREESTTQAIEASKSLLERAPTGRVGQFTLFQSTLDPKGPRYATLGRFPRPPKF